MASEDPILPIPRLLEILEQAGPSSPIFPSAARVLDSHLLPGWCAVPHGTPRGRERFLTIGMATFDDYDGVYFSVQAIRLFHPEITPQTEILVIDNQPEGASAGALKQLESQVENYRYVPYASHRGTSVRDLLFREASGQFVLGMDSHVQFAPGSLARLVEFLREQPDSNDLWQGPLLADDLKGFWSHLHPVWSDGMFGQWAVDERASEPSAPPFEIGMQGLGVFACRREAWPGLNPRFSGFGGEEGYIHEKFRRNGCRVFCLPFLRWTHRFNRPRGIPYGPGWRERIRNYLLGHEELGLDPGPVKEHFEKLLGVDAASALIEAAKRESSGPFHFFDAIYSTLQGDRLERWTAVDLDAKIRFLAAEETPLSKEIGRTLAHRRIIHEAQSQGLTSVLILDKDFVPCASAIGQLRDVADRLRRDPWKVRGLPGGVAYHSSAFHRLLDKLHATPSGIALWLRRGQSLEVVETRLEHGCAPKGKLEGFGFSVFGHRVSVLSDCRGAAAYLDRYLLPWLPRSEPQPDADGAVYRVMRSRDGWFQAYENDRLIAAEHGLPAILEMLQYRTDEKVIDSLPDRAAVHAGVVLWKGRAALLPGASQSGKTTLVAELLRRGALYYSDEYALLDWHGQVYPYPRALMVRSSGGWRQPVLPPTGEAASVDSPAVPRLILSLEWIRGGEWRVDPVPQSEALVVLLRNTPHEIASSPKILDPLRQAVSGANCYRGVRGDAENAADHVIELLAAHE